jgi:hypothetical protein
VQRKGKGRQEGEGVEWEGRRVESREGRVGRGEGREREEREGEGEVEI